MRKCPKYSAVQYEQRGGDNWYNKNGPLANLGQDEKEKKVPIAIKHVYCTKSYTTLNYEKEATVSEKCHHYTVSMITRNTNRLQH